MSKKAKTNLLKYGISITVCIALSLFYVCVRDFFAQDLAGKYRILCDAFTVPGVLALLSGALIAVTNRGALDGITYATTHAFMTLFPGGRLRTEKYYDYVQRKREKRIKSYGFLFVVGGIWMALALIFMILFYC